MKILPANEELKWMYQFCKGRIWRSVLHHGHQARFVSVLMAICVLFKDSLPCSRYFSSKAI